MNVTHLFYTLQHYITVRQTYGAVATNMNDIFSFRDAAKLTPHPRLLSYARDTNDTRTRSRSGRSLATCNFST